VSRLILLESLRLTAREAQILRLVAAGSTKKEMASELHLAVSTVERHLVNLYNKIGRGTTSMRTLTPKRTRSSSVAWEGARTGSP
jgi:DNA-binding NarL/FixJ family response regulator